VRTGVETYYARTYLPRYDVRLTRRFRHASFAASYGRTISPGNGVYLTSAHEGAEVSFSYFGMSRVRLGIGYGMQRYRSILQQNLGGYWGNHASGSFSYKLVRSLSLTANFGANQYSIEQSLHRTRCRVAIGLTWSPGDYPVSLW
jgi:hypothetical protein